MLERTLESFVLWLQTSGLRIMLILAGAWVLSRLVAAALVRLERSLEAPGSEAQAERQKRARTLVSVLRSLSLVVIGAVAGLMALAAVGVDITPFLAGVSIVGLALGLGAQTVVRDAIGGLLILAEEQFHVGDDIKVGEVAGTVERITLRATYLRDLDGSLHLVPNGEIRTVSNRTREWSRAVVDVGVGYEADIGQVVAALETVCQEVAADPRLGPLLTGPPEVTGVEGLGDYAVRLRILAKTRPGQQWEMARALRRRIKEKLSAQGIAIPYPRQEVHLRGD